MHSSNAGTPSALKQAVDLCVWRRAVPSCTLAALVQQGNAHVRLFLELVNSETNAATPPSAGKLADVDACC